jgi:hypothetical protein
LIVNVSDSESTKWIILPIYCMNKMNQ